MLTERTPSFVTVAGRRLAYEELGPAEPEGTILLLMGLAAKRQGWVRQLEAFGRRYRTIALENRDIGDSDPAQQPYRIADLAEDAAAALEALGVERAHVVGISMGGYIALELALRHAQLVDRLVLVATSAGGLSHSWPSLRMLLMLSGSGRREAGEGTRRTYAAIMAPGYAERHPEVMDQIAALARHRPQSLASYRRQLRACLLHDVTRRLRQLRPPTLIIHGADDPLCVVKNGESLARRIAGARLIVYPHTGHIPIIERAEEFNRDVLDFLSAR